MLHIFSVSLYIKAIVDGATNFLLNLCMAYQGTYLTSTARSHARDYNVHEGMVIGNFNGEFWGMFASNQVNQLVFLASLILCCFVKSKVFISYF